MSFIDWYVYVSYFFFFKQKTAYEMRISDWSSDVCSSDLPIFARYDFDFFVTFSSVTERALGAVMTIAYDLQDEAESAAALDCANALCETMMRAGFPPYREIGRAHV